MPDRVTEVLDGCLGYFVELAQTDVQDFRTADDRPGFIRQRERNLEVQLLLGDPDDMATPAPTAVLGATDKSGILCLDRVASSTTRAYGGSRVSYSVHRFDTFLAGVELSSVRSSLLIGAAAQFRGEITNAWAGLEASSTEIAEDASGRVEEFTLKLKSLPPLSADLGEGQLLELQPRWAVNHSPAVSPSVDIALEAKITPDLATEARQLLAGLHSFQELLCIAFNRHVATFRAVATCDGSSTRSEMWNATLMAARPQDAAQSRVTTDWLFSMSDLSGAEGVGRWIQLCRTHPRAIAPVVNRIRFGRTGAEVHLMELCAAIEYWVAAHRRTDEWTKIGTNPVQALGIELGSSMLRWCGDTGHWSDLVWSTYNSLKHNPRFVPDRRTVGVLANSAYVALVAALLNRSALSRSPSEAMLGSYQLSRLGADVRGLD